MCVSNLSTNYRKDFIWPKNMQVKALLIFVPTKNAIKNFSNSRINRLKLLNTFEGRIMHHFIIFCSIMNDSFIWCETPHILKHLYGIYMLDSSTNNATDSRVLQTNILSYPVSVATNFFTPFLKDGVLHYGIIFLFEIFFHCRSFYRTDNSYV